MATWLDPHSLGIKGSMQPELFEGTIQSMAGQMQSDPVQFWADSVAQDGLLVIWEINGERFLFNGNHRWHAAVEAGALIPAHAVQVVRKPASAVPTFRLQDMTRLPGVK